MEGHFEGALMRGISPKVPASFRDKTSHRSTPSHQTSPDLLQGGVSIPRICRMFRPFFRLYYLSLKILKPYKGPFCSALSLFVQTSHLDSLSIQVAELQGLQSPAWIVL